MKSDSRKASSSMASSRNLSPRSARPRFHVTISVNMPTPMSSGNQPPSSTFTTFAEKKTMSTTKNTPVAAMHSANGSFQA